MVNPFLDDTPESLISEKCHITNKFAVCFICLIIALDKDKFSEYQKSVSLYSMKSFYDPNDRNYFH